MSMWMWVLERVRCMETTFFPISPISAVSKTYTKQLYEAHVFFSLALKIENVI